MLKLWKSRREGEPVIEHLSHEEQMPHAQEMLDHGIASLIEYDTQYASYPGGGEMLPRWPVAALSMARIIADVAFLHPDLDVTSVRTAHVATPPGSRHTLEQRLTIRIGSRATMSYGTDDVLRVEFDSHGRLLVDPLAIRVDDDLRGAIEAAAAVIAMHRDRIAEIRRVQQELQDVRRLEAEAEARFVTDRVRIADRLVALGLDVPGEAEEELTLMPDMRLVMAGGCRIDFGASPGRQPRRRRTEPSLYWRMGHDGSMRLEPIS
jgi:hypothetical protein